MDFDQDPPAFDDIERLPVHILSSTPPLPSLATSRPAIRSRRTALPSLSTSPSSIPIDIPSTNNNTNNNTVNITTDTSPILAPTTTCTPASPPSSPPVLTKLSVKERKQHLAPSSALSKELELISAPVDITPPPAIDISDFECPLCFQVYLQPVTTPCGHVFCKQCLFRAFQHSCSCPLCRFKIDPSLNQKYSVNIVLMNVIEKYFPKEHRERVSQEESVEKTEEPLKNELEENARPNSPSNWTCILPSLRSTCTVLLSCGGF